MDEDKSILAATATINVGSPIPAPGSINGGGKKTPVEGEKATKKRGAFTFIKAAMFMARRRGPPSGKSKPPVASNDKLLKLVGSMRPLHLQDKSPPPSIGKQSEELISKSFSSPDRASSSSSASSVDSMSQYGSATNLEALDHKGGLGVMRSYASSPSLQALAEVNEGSDSRYASSTDLQKIDKRPSRYASAKDLLEFELKGESDDEDDEDEDEDEEEDLDKDKGDEMIDAKADEFIAKFYNQIKLQPSHSF